MLAHIYRRVRRAWTTVLRAAMSPIPCPVPFKYSVPSLKTCDFKTKICCDAPMHLSQMRRSWSREPYLPHLRLLPGLDELKSCGPAARIGRQGGKVGVLIMRIERLAGQREARQAVLLSIAGVTAIMLVANLFLIIFH